MWECPNGCEDTLFMCRQTVIETALYDEYEEFVEVKEADTVDREHLECQQCGATAVHREEESMTNERRSQAELDEEIEAVARENGQYEGLVEYIRLLDALLERVEESNE